MSKLARSLLPFFFITSYAIAQTPPAATDNKPEPIPALAGRPDATLDDLLGASFQSPVAGIAFRVPRSCNPVNKHGDEIARFANEPKTWELAVSKATSAQPLPLTGNDRRMGLLQVMVGRLKQANSGVEIFRQDTVKLADAEAGIISARAAVGSQRTLYQQAIAQANDQLYYTFTFTTPAAKDASGPPSNDPVEQTAVQAFTEMLDTIKLLDRGAIKDEQNERLYRTRGFFTTLNEAKLKSVLIPEQWMRLIRDGHDIGYTYIVEEEGNQGPADGIKIGIRSRSYPDQNTQVDGETWYFTSFDRKHETWRSLAWVQNIPTKASDQIVEIGTSDARVRRVLDRSGELLPGDKQDPKQPPVVSAETYNIEVQTIAKGKNAPVFKQELSPWYIPQAIGHLLPRLLPLRQPRTFMFASYVSDKRSVWERYVDVGSEQEVELGGKSVRAMPITDRIGQEGSPTIHYVTDAGQYLGSVNKDSKITILPTDATTLQKIWENKADLTRPREIQPTTRKSE